MRSDAKARLVLGFWGGAGRAPGTQPGSHWLGTGPWQYSMFDPQHDATIGDISAIMPLHTWSWSCRRTGAGSGADASSGTATAGAAAAARRRGRIMVPARRGGGG